MIVEQNKEQLNVVKLLPETLPSGKRIIWKNSENGLVEISVDKHSARGGNAKPIIIKRFIPINDLLFEGLGLRFGDGIKLQGGEMRVFGFSNINLEVHKHFLRFAKECFGLDSFQFRVAITIPPKLSNELNDIEANISKELNIPRENFFKTRILERRNRPIVDVKVCSRLIAFIINLIFENLKEMMLSNKIFSAPFLRGVIASEANVFVRNNKKLDEISIAAKDKSKRDMIRRCLTSIDILPSKDKEIEGQEAVLIHSLSNFRKCNEWNLTVLHPQKLNDFKRGIEGFRKEEFRKGECKFLVLKILSNPKSMKSTKELAKILNRKSRTINDAVAFLERKNLIKRIRSGRNIFWEITDDGITFLKNKGTINELRSNF